MTFTEADLLERSPFLAKLQRRRLAPSRWKDLLEAARSSRAPRPPAPSDCCGSSCMPCVKELHREELRVWNEVHPDGEGDEDEDDDSAQVDKAKDVKLETDLKVPARDRIVIEIDNEALQTLNSKCPTQVIPSGEVHSLNAW